MRRTIDESTTIRAGKVTVTVEADPLEHNFDKAALAEGPAEAMRQAFRDGIRSITEAASPATQKQRAVARRAYDRNKPWAIERYGPHPPGKTDRLFNDSGGLADGLQLERNGDAFNITAEHMDVPGMTDRLADLVPAIANPLEVPAVNAAIAKSWSKIFRREVLRESRTSNTERVERVERARRNR